MSAVLNFAAPAVDPAQSFPRRGLLIAAVILGASYLAGGLLGAFGALQTTAGAVTPSTATTPAVELFVHNAGVLLALGAGLVTAGLLTAVVLFYNGLVLGWVVGKAVGGGFGSLLLTGLLPHALPELAGYIVSGAASVVLGVDLGRHVVTRHPRQHGARLWWRCQGVSLVLLGLAAVLERTVSHA